VQSFFGVLEKTKESLHQKLKFVLKCTELVTLMTRICVLAKARSPFSL
jgi:hypothetical protein